MKSFGYASKMVSGFLIASLVPLTILGFLVYQSSEGMRAGIGKSYQAAAESLIDRVERNLFERYGDVQAFGFNSALQDKASWYVVGSASNAIARVANQYAALYGMYQLSVVVDLEGKVIAVNDRSPKGEPIDTAWLYDRSFKDASWFQDALAGRFLKSPTLSGTVVQEVAVSEEVKKIYSDEGLVLGYSAPVTDRDGKAIAVWHNLVAFSVVEEMFEAVYRGFSKEGLSSAALTLVDSTGRILIQHHPKQRNGDSRVFRDMGVILRRNLKQESNPAAIAVVNGQAGYTEDTAE
ncbi:MAG: hypothetical protein FJ405_16855, partial [Verrucomicrobia bacterium]|nr:hypothetical protein [Verrucomicrobiota bacterium]